MVNTTTGVINRAKKILSPSLQILPVETKSIHKLVIPTANSKLPTQPEKD